jgi:uncharacterized surface protein with fasciclin (FAS1) repeats
VKRTPLSRGVVAVAVAGLTLALGACGSDEPADSSASASTASSATESTESTAAVPSDQPFGEGCAVPAEGPGSFAAMAAQPVVTAASTLPSLSTVVQAVTAANLADSLNTLQNITVLIPANQAFEAIPADQLQALLADSARLTAVLTHHVIQGRLAPEQLAGTHTTLNNDEVTVEGSGDTFTIAGDATISQVDATVICGNVQTANATVYVIDQVLAPPAA